MSLLITVLIVEVILYISFILFVIIVLSWEKTLPLRTALKHLPKLLTTAFLSTVQLLKEEDFHTNDKILHAPYLSQHEYIYRALLQFCHAFPPDERDSILTHIRRHRFSAVAEALLKSRGSVRITEYHMFTMSPARYEHLDRLAAQPSIILTPPVDGNREPQMGERGGPKWRQEKKYLNVPKKVWKTGKKISRKERERIAREHQIRLKQYNEVRAKFTKMMDEVAKRLQGEE